MTVKRVVCPKCNQAMNVVATMTSVKCQSCQHIFQLDANGNAKASSQNAGPSSGSSKLAGNEESSDGKASGLQALIVVGCMLALALIGLAALAVISSDDSTQPTSGPNAESAAGFDNNQSSQDSSNGDTESSETPSPQSVDYRVVQISEAARKRVYTAYRQTFDSSLGKSKKIPQGGKAGQSLNNMLGQTVDREITHLSLLNNISEDDVRQIIAEGDDKGWK